MAPSCHPFVVAAVQAAILGWTALAVLSAVVGTTVPVEIPRVAAAPPVSYPVGVRNGRPVYRYSVVPGGVYSSAELTDVLSRDSVAAAHYAALDPNRVVLTVLDRPRAAFVSYRVGGQTFWTNHRVVLPKGEALLTDGTTTIRARCGNLVSDEAVAGASDEKFDPSTLDQTAPAVIDAGGFGDPDSAAFAVPDVLALADPGVPLVVDPGLWGPLGVPFTPGLSGLGPAGSDDHGSPDPGVIGIGPGLSVLYPGPGSPTAGIIDDPFGGPPSTDPFDPSDPGGGDGGGIPGPGPGDGGPGGGGPGNPGDPGGGGPGDPGGPDGPGDPGGEEPGGGSPVPEPSAFVLVGAGLVAVRFMRRCR